MRSEFENSRKTTPQNEWTELDEILRNRFRAGCKDQWDVNKLIFIALSATEYGIEEELVRFLKESPNATLEETDRFVSSILPATTVEIVDDEELDEDERTD